MSNVSVRAFSLSLDGFAVGPEQSQQNPIGVNGMALHEWLFKTRTFRTIHGQEGGETGVDDQFVMRGFENVGAWIIGRNMFGPVRGPWPDESWKGWWGENPPYHAPVFVLTHHPRASIAMKGGTTFHFVSDGIESALRRARDAANGKDIRVGGGVSVVQQFLRARLIDDMHLAVAPVFLGAGENLFTGLDLRALGYACVDRVSTANVVHLTVRRQH